MSLSRSFLSVFRERFFSAGRREINQEAPGQGSTGEQDPHGGENGQEDPAVTPFQSPQSQTRERWCIRSAKRRPEPPRWRQTKYRAGLLSGENGRCEYRVPAANAGSCRRGPECEG